MSGETPRRHRGYISVGYEHSWVRRNLSDRCAAIGVAMDDRESAIVTTAAVALIWPILASVRDDARPGSRAWRRCERSLLAECDRRPVWDA